MARRQEQQGSFFGDDFGQKVDLTARIREILRNYPEGTSIFKELIQNADDAGANEVRLVLDERTHATGTLASPAMASLQGPALLCYNDAQFSEVDFQSIQRIGDSLKKEESRGAKTGRFGVGFNSVYHVTEVPTFVSASRVIMFDPQAAYLPNPNPANPGKMIDFLEHRSVVEALPDQFRPLQAFGCDLLSPTPTAFLATLFRFPLRTAAQAETSRLSEQAHSVPAMRAQLEVFAREAAGMLLFLKNVERLSVWLWPAAQQEPVQVAEAHVANATEELRRQRNFVARTLGSSGASAATRTAAFVQQPVGCEYVLETAATVMPPFAPGATATSTKETWLVCNRLGGGQAGVIAAAREYQHMKLIPWAGVAGRVAVSHGAQGQEKEDGGGGGGGVEGLAYCFLPLPVPTQLPVHVNAFFELSSNRRDLWWSGDDMVGDGALRATWNRSLLCEVVVPCYTRLLQLAAQRCGPGAVYDALWPVRGGGPAWAQLLDAFFMAVAPLPLVHTALVPAPSARGRGGLWGVGAGGSSSSNVAGGGQWVAPRDAVVIPPEARRLQQQQQQQQQQGEGEEQREDGGGVSLDRVLLQEGLAVLKTSRPELEEALVTRKVVARVATPEFVRAHFRLQGQQRQQQQQQQQHPALKDKGAVLLLLQYCVSDLSSDHSCAALDGLPLLPVSDATAPPRTIVLYATAEGSPAVQQLVGMGVPVGLALRALRLHPPAKATGKASSGVEAALAWILDEQAGAETAGEPFGLGDLVLGALEPTEEVALFQRVAARLVDLPQLPDKARAILQAPRFQKASNVRSLAPALLPTVLRYSVPPSWRDAERVPWSSADGANKMGRKSSSNSSSSSNGNDPPDLAWFLALWPYLLEKMNDDLRPLADGVPFLPCNKACVVRLSAKLPVLLLPASSPSLAAPLLAALRELGVLTVHDALVAKVGEARLGAALRAFVQPARRSGVLGALRLLSLDARFSGSGKEQQQPLSQQERLAAFSRALAAALVPEAKDAVRALLLSEPLAELSQEELGFVAALPVFRVYGGSEGAYMSMLAAAASPLFLLEGVSLPTLQVLEGLVPPQFLRADDPLEPALLKRLGARPLSKAAFLVEHFFPTFAAHRPALRTRAMLEVVLADLPALAQADARVLPALRELSFLPTAGPQQEQGQQQQPLARCMDLYDPEVEELTALCGAELFPHPDFAAPETLALLRQLGLRSMLGFADVVRIALSTQAVYAEAAAAAASSKAKAKADAAEEALGKARTLFRFLNENAERFFTPVRESAEAAAARRKKGPGALFSRALSLFDEQVRAAERSRQERLEQEERARQTMVEELKRIHWVPVLASPPLPFLPWRRLRPDEAPGLVAPAHARLYEDMWYASARFGIVAQDTQVAELVKSTYGWRAPLPPAVVAHQLVAIAAAFHDYSSSSAATAATAAHQQQEQESSSAVPPSVQAMQQQVASVVPVVYQMLSGVRDPAGQDQIRRALSGAPWVFVGDRFVQAEQVAFAAPVDATPYLYSVPADLACFAPLLKAHGVRPAFGAGDFVQVLQAMAVETGSGVTPKGAGGSKQGGDAKPLTAQQLELAIALVQRISDESMMVTDWEIFVPDEAGVLARSSELVYDDAPWLSKMQNRADIRFAHPKISSVTGDKLGIRSVRRLLMESHADAMDFGLPTEAFGQSEALTRRLRHILELYPEGPSVLSELIQNADDAGASTVRVLYSSRRYGTTALLGGKMASWQGPALYFYNDAVFSHQDFVNIARIGQASKLDKVVSTGRFGLGFNATYHCTDVPSFVSNEHLVMFDPHVRFLPGATRQQPGIKIRFVDTDLLGQFPDQFEPYTLFGCTLKEAFAGTLFRFPVRTPELARESEISKSCYDGQTVKELFASFQASISRFLLFLRHVDNIEVYVAHGPASAADDGGPQLLYRASRAMDDRTAWNEATAFMTGPPRAPLSKEAFYAKLASTPVAHLPRVKELVRVAYHEGRVGFEGQALRARRRRLNEYMLLAGLGGGAALAMAVDAKHKHLKLIPFGGVAAHIYTQEGVLEAVVPPLAIEDGDGRISSTAISSDDPLMLLDLGPKRLIGTGLAKRGQAFCFLPLPVDSGLPVFVNACFELSSNRRDVWSGSDMSGEGALRAAWNQALLQDVVAPLYAQLVQEAAALLTPSESGGGGGRPPLGFYYSLFPNPEAALKHFAVVATRFYELIGPRAVLWSELRGGSWAPAQTAMLVDMEPEDEEQDEKGGKQQLQRQLAAVSAARAGEKADAARLRAVLLARGCCIVPVPPPLKRVLAAEQCCHHEVSPPLVRQLVREAKGLAYQPGKRERGERAGSAFTPWPATQEDAQLLLVYCASDLVERGDVGELDGLPLLPLADGTLGTLAVVGLQEGLTTYFVVGEAERPLFAHGQHVLVLERERLLPKVAALLENAALMQPTNVVRFGPAHLDAFLQEVLPPPFADALEVAWRPGEALGGRVIPDVEWVRRFWSYLATARGVAASSSSASQAPSSSSSPLRLLGRGGNTAPAGMSSSTASLSAVGGNCSFFDVARLCGRWPLLPVLRGREKARMLVRLEAALPLLHISHVNLPALSSISGGAQALEERLEGALTAMDVRVVDRDALPDAAEPLLAAPESQALVKPLTTHGLLATLRKLCAEGELANVAPLFARVGPSGRRALRAQLGSARQIDAARKEARSAEQLEALVQALRCLPIYESYEGSAMSEAEQRERVAALGSSSTTITSSGGAIVAFCALTAWPDHWLPSDGVDPRLLDTGKPTFIRSTGIEDAQLLDLVGVRPIPLPAFYQQHVLAALPRLAPDVRLAAVAKLLSDVPRLRQADVTFVAGLKEAAFVPDGAGALKRADALHDPLQGGLTALLEKDAFPAAELCTPEAVARLRTLGLRATLSLGGVLASAASVEALATAGDRDGAVRRGKELLRFLDRHLEELAEAEAEDAEGEEMVGAGAGGEEHLQRQRLPLAFVQELRRHAWVPIRQLPPHPSLPWPSTAMPLVLPPTGTRPQGDMWLCSMRRGIAEIDVSSLVLRQALGWEDPVDPTTLAYQLVGLAAAFHAGRGGSFRQILGKTAPEIYESLLGQIVEPVDRALRPEHAAVPRVLAGASWIWVGDEFLPVTRVAFVAPPNSRPYLVQVPPELERYSPLLRVLGVRESFTVPDLARALAALHEGSRGPLPSLDLQQAIGLLRALQKTPFEERQEALRADVAIFAPSEDGTMHRIDTLCYNDAPWLLATVEGRVDLTFVHKDLPNDVARALGARSLREALLANQCAMAAIPCARAKDIQAVLAPLTLALKEVAGEEPAAVAGELALRAVLDVLELADEVGCRRVEVVADGRTHGSESLLHPLLASAQGPALLIHLHDVVISLDDLIRLASPTRLKNGPLTRPYPPPPGTTTAQPQPQQRRAASLGRSRTGSEDDRSAPDAAAYAWPVSGLGLSSLFHLTDLVQVLSGDTFVLFDPAAQFLVSEATVDTTAADAAAPPSSPAPAAATATAVLGGEPQPVARRYTMSMGQCLHERFPHQFAPFASLGAAWMDAAAAGEFSFQGTVIRCPLRRQGSTLSPVVAPSVEGLPWARLLESVPPSLLFSLSLDDVGVVTWSSSAAAAEPLARARLLETTPAGMRRFRRELMEQKEWRKNKLLAQLFKGNSPAPLSIHVAEVACEGHGRGACSEQWLLLDALAHGASRDAALSEALKTTLGGQSLLPLISAVVRLQTPQQPSPIAGGKEDTTALVSHTGRAFSIVDTGGVLGLPCHVSAPFFLCDALVPALGEHLARGRVRRDFRFTDLGGLSGTGGRLRGDGADDLDRLARWNRALLSALHDEVLPALLATLRDLIVQGQGDGRGLYRFWPRIDHAPGRLKPLMRASGLGDRLATGGYFWARRPRGEPPAYVKLGEAFFFDGRKWGTGTGNGSSARLADFLGRLFPLFDVPDEILNELRARNAPIKEVTPALLRRHLRAQAQTQASIAAATGALPRSLVQEVAATPGLALDLLRFCLGDCGPLQAKADGVGACRARWRELAGLPLLPLEDGAVRPIAGGGNSSGTMPFILADAEQRALLPQLRHRFVSAAAARFLLEELELASLADALSALGMVRFGPDILAANVHSVLPPAWKGLVRVAVDDWAGVGAPLSPLWLHRFWRQVPLGLAEDLFAAWPLVPVSGGRELVTCALASRVLRLMPEDLDAQLQAQLEAQTAGATDGETGGRWSVQGGRRSSARPASVEGKLGPRDICLDVKEVDLLYQQLQAAIAPAVAAPHAGAEGEEEDSPVVGAAAFTGEHGDEQAALPVATEVVHGNHGGGGSSADVPVVAAEEEDAEVSSATAGAVQQPPPLQPISTVSDGAARLAAALTAPERERRQELLKVLKKARAPVLELAFFPREAHALLTVTEPRDVTRAVIASLYIFKESVALTTGPGGALTGEELDGLLRRVTTSSGGEGGGQLPVALTASEVEKLKQLPFFETLGGERVPIAEGGPYLVLDDREAGRDRFLDELLSLLAEASAAGSGAGSQAASSFSPSSPSSPMSQSKVLKRKAALDDLYKDLGVAALKKSEILSRFLVPSLPSLDRPLRLRVLELLRKRWASENMAADATLVAALKETPFLERPNGELASPSELLDPRSDVLRDVFEDDPGVFPQGEFASAPWLSILGAVGMQSRAGEGFLLEAAKRLEAFASLSPLPFAVACKAAKLVRHFVGDSDLSVDKALLKKLAPVRFVPVERPGLHMIGPGPDSVTSASSSGGRGRGAASVASSSSSTAMTPNRQYQLVSFAEAAPAKDRHLVWTVAPVLLPTHVPAQLSWSALGIVSPPSKERVVQHLANLCSDSSGGGGGESADGGSSSGGGGSVLDRWVFAEPPVVVFQSLFSYLQEQWVALPPATQRRLKDLPCVPVGNRLVRPSRLFFRLAQDLAPFLFEVPRAFGAYDRLLRDGLGVRAVPAVQDYARLLAELKQECGESALNPNELEAVVKVVCLLADITAERDDAGGGGQRHADLLRGWQLYAPDDRAVLVPLKTCLYDDASWLRGRVHAHLLRAVHPRIGLEACRAFGIPRISQVVRETLAPDFVPEPVSALERQPAHGDPALLTATLTSAEFAHALACLFAQRDGTWAHMSRQLLDPSFSDSSSSSTTLRVEEMAAAVHRALQGFRVEWVRTLRCRFLRRGAGGREETDITSQPEGSMFFVDAERRAVLLAVIILPPSVTPAYVLAMAVAQVFALGAAAEGGGEWVVAPMSALLATHPPGNVRQVMALLRLDARDEARAQHLRRGVPGQLLLEADKAGIEFRPLRVHMQGEIVAWQESKQTPLRYGTVVSSSLAGGAEEDEGAGSAGGSADSVVRRLLVRIGPGKVQEMLSTQVYSFRTTKASDGGGSSGNDASATPSAMVALRSPLLQPRSETTIATGAAASAALPSSVVGEGAASAAATLAPVESAQLLSAVDDILGRVNLSLGEEPKAVMERNIRLQRDLEAACREAEGAREQALGLESQLDKIKASFQCQVCFQHDVNQILAPCGHLLCGSCRESVQTTCPFCRERIRFVFPFFKPFSS